MGNAAAAAAAEQGDRVQSSPVRSLPFSPPLTRSPMIPPFARSVLIVVMMRGGPRKGGQKGYSGLELVQWRPVRDCYIPSSP